LKNAVLVPDDTITFKVKHCYIID